ncbi:MAG: hypothetical protein IPI34_14795, partial [bacterium]|nr:hypothetical protein [bacterium]
MKFRRWLNVEQPAYDHAYVRVSNDGVNWVTVWQNTAEVADAAWSLAEFDISAVADRRARCIRALDHGQHRVQLAVLGLEPRRNRDHGAPALAGHRRRRPAAGRRPRLRPLSPQPVQPLTEVRFDLPTAGPARLAVYDVRGHLVKVLSDGELPAGEHAAVWDGTDARGRAMSSGSYVFRLTAG